MKPTPEHLAALATRILAVMPRTGGRQLDTAAGEVAILIGDLCHTTEAAERLADQLTRHPWRRWSFPEFEAVARHMLQPAPPAPTEAAWHAALVPELMLEPEYQGLHRRAVRGRLFLEPPGGPDIMAAESDARQAAKQDFNAGAAAGPRSKAARDHAELMEACRAEFIHRISQFPDLNRHGRLTTQPFLDRNARDIAEDRIYRHLVFDEPIMLPWAQRAHWWKSTGEPPPPPGVSWPKKKTL